MNRTTEIAAWPVATTKIKFTTKNTKSKKLYIETSEKLLKVPLYFSNVNFIIEETIYQRRFRLCK
jgi:hypothetical protein